MLELDQSYEEMRREFPEEMLVKVFTFNSMRKSMMTVIHRPEGAGYRLHAKGASEIILNRCKFILGTNGHLEPFDEEERQLMISTVIEPMAADGLRTIAIAYKDFVPEQGQPNEVSTK